MDELVRSFTSLWELKFPGACLPDTSFFESHEKLDTEIVSRAQKIDHLRLELRQQEFLLEYLQQTKTKGLCTYVKSDNSTGNAIGRGTEASATNLDDDDVDDFEKDGQFSSNPDIYHTPSVQHSQLVKKQSESLDSGIGATSKSTMSLAGEKSCSAAMKCNVSDTESSESDGHEYMDPEEYSIKPLPKLPQKLASTTSEEDADVYQNLHMKPKLEKLKTSSDDDDDEEYSVPPPQPTLATQHQQQPTTDQDIYSVPKGVPDRKVKRLGSNDRKGTTFSEDMDVFESAGPKIVIDRNTSCQDEEDSPIYANISDVVSQTKMSDTDDSDNDGLHESCEPHYREMTLSEIEKLRCCGEDKPGKVLLRLIC